MPKSACIAGKTTTTPHMPKLPSMLMAALAHNRHQAYRESTPDIGFAGSAAQRALGVDVERVQRMACRHEQPVAIAAAEADVGAALGQLDVADRLAVGIEYAHAVKLGRAHAPAAPQIAVGVDAEAVGRAARAGVDQHLAVGEPGAAVDHVVGHD